MKTTFTIYAVLLFAFGSISQTTLKANDISKIETQALQGQPLQAQTHQAKDYFTIRGTVKDNASNRILEYASISLKGTNIGTITNANGYFSLKVASNLSNAHIEVTYIGYNTVDIPIDIANSSNLNILLKPLPIVLDEITIKAIDASELVAKAIDKIQENYSQNAQLLSGFYRETIRKRKTYINVSEAVVDIYKSPYKEAHSENYSQDMLSILKGRKLISTKPSDTIMVKFLGGPNLALYLDIVKNPDLMLTSENLFKYKFYIDQIVMIQERPHYVVSFVPQVEMPYALHYGKLFIDKSSLTISRAEFSVDMTDRNKVTQALLRKKPMNMRFRPENISYLVTYKQINGKTYLNYIRNEIQFKCDWTKKFFSTNYTIVSETVITGGSRENIEKFKSKFVFRDNQSLSDKVVDFNDVHFWENYNIIEPDESLENAVSRLLKSR